MLGGRGSPLLLRGCEPLGLHTLCPCPSGERLHVRRGGHYFG